MSNTKKPSGKSDKEKVTDDKQKNSSNHSSDVQKQQPQQATEAAGRQSATTETPASTPKQSAEAAAAAAAPPSSGVSYLVVRLVGLAIIASALIYLIVQKKPAPTSPTEDPTAATNTTEDYSASSLEIIDLQEGTGALLESGATVSLHYRGTFTDGSAFDDSYGRNQPITIVLGAGQVIAGWDQGLVGMKVGGKRKLVIPPELAYGVEGRPPAIPPSSTLIFEIEALSAEAPPQAPTPASEGN